MAPPSPGLNIDASMSSSASDALPRQLATCWHALSPPSASIHVSSCRSSSPFHLRHSLKLVAANSTSPPLVYCSPRARRRELEGRDRGSRRRFLRGYVSHAGRSERFRVPFSVSIRGRSRETSRSRDVPSCTGSVPLRSTHRVKIARR